MTKVKPSEENSNNRINIVKREINLIEDKGPNRQQLLGALSNDPDIKFIYCYNQGLDIKCTSFIRTLRNVLKENDHVNYVRFSGGYFKEGSVRELVELIHLNKLSEIDLSHNCMTYEGITKIHQAISEVPNCKLKFLHLEGNLVFGKQKKIYNKIDKLLVKNREESDLPLRDKLPSSIIMPQEAEKRFSCFGKDGCVVQ